MPGAQTVKGWVVTGGLALAVLASCGRDRPTPTPIPTATAQPTPVANPDAPLKPALASVPVGSHFAVPDRLELPSIGLDVPVVELGWHKAAATSGAIFSEWDVAEYAAGWHTNSARLGEHGNVVMSGHNNILGAVFRELDQLREGDEAVVWSGDEKTVYRIDKIFIVPEQDATPEQRADNAKWIGPFDDDRLTLVSCWPRNNNTHRIVIIARPRYNKVTR